ncbi:Exosome complex component RRP42, partial [Cucurbita argyrosperma subsp. argyrosperma]
PLHSSFSAISTVRALSAGAVRRSPFPSLSSYHPAISGLRIAAPVFFCRGPHTGSANTEGLVADKARAAPPSLDLVLCGSPEVGMKGLSVGEKLFIQGGIAQDLRTDGRRRLTYRPISVETDVISQANGSARVRMGGTEVIATVKAELGRPNAMQPDKGKVSIFVDCSPTAEPTFEGRGGEELATELSVALEQCLLGGKSGAGIPKVNVSVEASANEQPEVDVSDEEFLQFDTSGVPVIVTLTKVGRHYIVDATLEEESQMSSAISISVNRHGHVCGLTKRGGAGVDPSVILDMISVGKHVSEQLLNKLDSEIAAAEADEEE